MTARKSRRTVATLGRGSNLAMKESAAHGQRFAWAYPEDGVGYMGLGECVGTNQTVGRCCDQLSSFVRKTTMVGIVQLFT